MHGGRTYYVYILANKIGGTLYIGVTNDLVRRIYEHKSDVVDGLIHDLVYFEQFDDVENAIRREKTAQKVESPMEKSVDRRIQSKLE